MSCVIDFPPNWVNAQRFESALVASGGPHGAGTTDVVFKFPVGSKIMMDGAIRLLSLVNQLVASSHRVRLEFEEGADGTMGYLNRTGFFDHLSHEVAVVPHRPLISAAMLRRGSNTALVEITRINKSARDEGLPSRLTAAVTQACSNRPDIKDLEGAAWTIFAELIDNVFAHSSTQLDGYAALQVYPGGNRLSVAVSDSGLGIMQTLRPSLMAESPRLAQLSDVDLLVEVFRQGLSRHGNDRGCGLKGCAAKAIKFNGTLDVRLPNLRVLLEPARGSYEPNRAYCSDGIPLLWGTHIAFAFGLGP